MQVYNEDEAMSYKDGVIYNGDYCKVYGDNCVINGDYGTVYGKNCVINGDYGTVYGKNAVINGRYCTCFEKANVINDKSCIAYKGSKNTNVHNRSRVIEYEPYKTKSNYEGGRGGSYDIFHMDNMIMHYDDITFHHADPIEHKEREEREEHKEHKEHKEHVEHKEHKEHVEHVEHKEHKEHKEREEHKEHVETHVDDQMAQMVLLLTGLTDTPNDTEQACVVCLSQSRIIAPQCGHRQLCAACALHLIHTPQPLCPSCRTPITKVIRIYD